MKVGTGLFPQSVDHAVAFAEFLETETGYEKLWMTDSHQLYVDTYVALACCARATQDLELGTGVTNPVTRHPTVTANAISSVSRIAGGATTLGIGAGDSAVYSIGRTPATVEELRETTVTIERLLDGETIDFDGEPFQLAQRNDAVRVDIAAEGPQTLRMAGEVADGVIFGAGTEPDLVERGLEHVERGAERAGRSLDDVTITLLAPSCVDESRSAAVEKLLDILEPIAYHNFSFSVDDAPAELRDELRELVDRHDMREHGRADAEPTAEISPEVREYLGDRFAVAGTPAECRRRLERLAGLGIDELLIGSPVEEQRAELVRFEENVLEPLAV
jgi:5,10-methylenetetrahydromethanopterin reductase